MIWLIYSILTAFFNSVQSVFSKSSLKNVDEYVTAWALRFFALIFLLPILFFIEIPPLSKEFWIALGVSGGLNIITGILFMRALKKSDLSIVTPLVTSTPVFVLITSPIILHEYPTVLGFFGVLLVVAGAYILNIKESHKGYFEPLKALIRQEGPKIALLVAFIWSITTNFDKIGIRGSSVLFWLISIHLFLAAAMTPIMLVKSKQRVKDIKYHLPPLILAGFFGALTLLFQMAAISITNVAYVNAVKRLSVLFAAGWGYLIFKEKGIKERFLASAVMILGVLLIAFS